MIHIYYGYGRGKTSILNGSAIRAKGANMKVGVFRFLKGRETSEDSQLKKLDIPVFKFQSSEKFVIQMSVEEKFKARNEALAGMRYVITNKNKFDVIVLDELIDLTARNVNFITETDLIEFLQALGDKEILISGHDKHERVFEKADLITHLQPEKHYYEKGVTGRPGIEF